MPDTMNHPVSLQALNLLNQADFVNTLGAVFEQSPWVAELVFTKRPFTSLQTLHSNMLQVVNNATRQNRITLIRSHPELAGKEAEAGELTEESKNEQYSAGLDHCSPQQLHKLRIFNHQYRNKFGFPFVIAVKQLTREDILNSLEKRLDNSVEQEFNTCINEIGKIAKFRLQQIIQS